MEKDELAVKALHVMQENSITQLAVSGRRKEWPASSIFTTCLKEGIV
jgi:hypothetical protein